jgi:hypothetical protein
MPQIRSDTLRIIQTMDTLDLITVTRYGTTINNVASLNASKANEYEHNLVTFLGAAQAHGINFVPITWQPNLDQAGRGATAEIRQSLLSLQTSLVFKRIQPSRFSKRSEEASKEGETKAFHALISEISVLGLAGQHPNISNLLGICWDVNEDRAAWPVLVFKKAPLGNMDEFMRLYFDNARSWVTKVKLIAGIARAVEYMHTLSKVTQPNIPESLLNSFLQKPFMVILNHRTS